MTLLSSLKEFSTLHISSMKSEKPVCVLFHLNATVTTVSQKITLSIVIPFTQSLTMPVAWLGLIRDTGWFPKSLAPQLKPLYHACFLPWCTTGSSVRLLCFRCVPLTVSPYSRLNCSQYCRRIKDHPTPNKQPDTWPIGNIWAGWLQLPVHAHTPETIKTHARWEDCFT